MRGLGGSGGSNVRRTHLRGETDEEGCHVTARFGEHLPHLMQDQTVIDRAEIEVRRPEMLKCRLDTGCMQV